MMNLRKVKDVAPTTLARFLKKKGVPVTSTNAKSRTIYLPDNHFIMLTEGEAQLFKREVTMGEAVGSMGLIQIGPTFTTAEDLLSEILKLNLPDQKFIEAQRQEQLIKHLRAAAELLPDDYTDISIFGEVYYGVGKDEMYDLQLFINDCNDPDCQSPK